MCQQVNYQMVCTDCGRNMGQRQSVHPCSQARRRRRKGACDQGIVAHRGAPYTDQQLCRACTERYEQSMIDRNDDYRGNYTW
ncbi:uncharacterized protein PG986_002887 [Apiospora aurea]|uniref:Uncharacterized protein n=1 Tax=Apiospora aurea TaxID=335848 RepID=A0ABR1QQ35_9PEZI